ncbi:hypothetical protein E1B28_006680 [Marasmius oreades]|uniref:Uncharacterized protein n=1 Tax=Marasmius oreades TaxID=181124 RepID=A0A9P8AAV4_9AGAR|nr:uncharacterized protein E1B28_006680 [Marasmius oreades]KAG7095998.1 hypothetical protein E1B28_006680 [Marasmius oreades]
MVSARPTAAENISAIQEDFSQQTSKSVYPTVDEIVTPRESLGFLSPKQDPDSM